MSGIAVVTGGGHGLSGFSTDDLGRVSGLVSRSLWLLSGRRWWDPGASWRIVFGRAPRKID